MEWEWLKEFAKGMIKPALSLALLLITIALSYFQKLGLEGEMIWSIIRPLLQLSIVGFVLEFIFKQKNNTWMMVLVYVFMIFVAGYTAGRRAKHIPRGMYVAGASILAGTSLTMLSLILLKVFPFTPRYIIPAMGMMVASALRVTGVTMKNLRDEMKMQTNLLETAIALGATPRQATIQQVKRSVIISLSPRMDNSKTLGIVFLPGAMTGLMLAGASPLEAIQLQLVVTSLSIGACTFSSVISTYLSMPSLFTRAYQLQNKVFISD